MPIASTLPFSIKQGDLARPIKAVLTDQSGGLVDLTSASSVTFKMTQITTGTPKVVSGPGVITITGSVVSYQWQAGDTSVVGSYQAEFVVNWTAGEDTFPSDGYIDVEIYAEL